MTILNLLEQVAADVTAEDFHAACAHLGRFAATQAVSFQSLPTPTALLHGPHESGLTLIYLCAERPVPRRHGTWCMVAPLREEVEVQNWTEVIPPAEFTGDLMAHALPDVHYRCAVGDGLFVPEGQLFTIVAEHGVEVLLLFGEHPNHTWPESRSYGASQHAERVLRYPESPVSTL
jgi:hypothetical protein